MERLKELDLTCPFEGCKQKLKYAEFYSGYEGFDPNSDLRSDSEHEVWPKTESHFFCCEYKPIRCLQCKTQL